MGKQGRGADGEDGGARVGGVVTSVRAMAGRPGWVSVCVDRRRVGAVTAEAAAGMGVVVGAEWSADRAGAFVGEAARLDALHAGIVMLRQGERTGAELVNRLREKGHAADVVARAVDELRARGLVDDARVAAARAGGGARRGLAEPAIEAKLIGLGHDPWEARRAAAEAVRGIDPVAEAERLVRARLAMARGEDAARMRRRMAGLLGRNGYEQEVVREVLRRVLGDEEV